MSFLEIILVGNVGRDPELRFTAQGTAVCNFSMAVNRTFTRDGERQQETTWFKITVWGAQAETCNQYLAKGSQCLVVGDRIEASAYAGNDGSPRASLEVTARSVRFLSGRGEHSQGDEQPAGEGGHVDDIPF